MNGDLTEMANKAFPAGPDRVALYPVAGQQRVLAALQQDVAARQHVLCVTGPAGSGKTVILRALLQSLDPGLIGMTEKPTPGRVLVDVARGLHVDTLHDDEIILRRQLVMMLSMAEKQHIPIIPIIDEVDCLSTDDFNLLLHFFPSGLATLIFAGVTVPATWLAGGTTSAGSPPVVHTYQIDPLSADETAGYIHHRLSAAALPVDLLRPDTIAAIHQKTGGLPGSINRYCVEELAHAGERMKDKVAALEPAAVSNIKADKDTLWPTLDEDIDSEVMTAPVRRREHRKVLPATPSPLKITHEADVARQVRSLRRRARRWRIAAILACVTLAAVLTKNAWIDRIPSSHPLLASLAERFSSLSTSEHSVDESGQSKAASSPSNSAGSQEQAFMKQNSDFTSAHTLTTMPDTNDTGPPLSKMITTPAPAPALRFSPEPSAATPINSVSPVREKLGKVTGTTLPQSTLPASKGAESKPPKSKRAQSMPSGSTPQTPQLTRAQRNEVGHLYAVRAEYEWGKGDLGAAAISIERGLVSDPGNPRLLQMHAELPDVLRGP